MTNNFCWQKLDYCALSLFGGIHDTIVNCYLASVSVNNTLQLSGVHQISPDIHCHLPEKSQSSTVGNNSAPTSVPLSLRHALYITVLSPGCCVAHNIVFPGRTMLTTWGSNGATATAEQQTDSNSFTDRSDTDWFSRHDLCDVIRKAVHDLHHKMFTDQIPQPTQKLCSKQAKWQYMWNIPLC